MPTKDIPDIIVGRLPKYLQTLQRLKDQGQDCVSSQDLGTYLGISSAQIRKDLSQFGEFGKQGTGYSIPYLVNQLQKILKVDRTWEIALIGAGHLGHAIARYQGFQNRGFVITHVYDKDPDKVGKTLANLVIKDAVTMVEDLRTNHIVVAMLTVPASEAQRVTDELVKAGVHAILNYAPVALKVPSGVLVKDIDPINGLQHMTYYL
jgi:redox-sensing transcriptional repressor